MKPLTIEEAVAAMEGTVDRTMPCGSIARISIDSREVTAGDLFVAIPGRQFDGHRFVSQAFTAGAMAAVVRNDYVLPKPRKEKGKPLAAPPYPTLIRVDNTIVALGRLARYYRRSVIEGGVTIVAVTGSNGKTTTKSMIAHLIGARLRGRSAIKSFNNEIGVPLTLLSTEPSDEFLICEVGTNAPGEIATLARLIEPQIAVITGVAEVHLAGLRDIEGVATEKLSLLHHLRQDGCAVINVDPEVLRQKVMNEKQYASIKKITFGEWPEADLRLTSIKSIPSGTDTGLLGSIEFVVNDRFSYRLNTPGRHNAINALAAIAVARRFGMDHEEIAIRLETFELPPMRLQAEQVGRITLINDGYNANPASMAAALNVLLDTPASGRRIIIVGDMRELGDVSHQRHVELGEQIGKSGVDLAIAIGENATLIRETVNACSRGRIPIHAYDSTDQAMLKVPSLLKRNDTILIKGSRALALEHLAETVRKWATKRPAKANAGHER